MKTQISILSAVCLMSCFAIAGVLTSAAADYDYYADRLSREHRVANDVDEWIERGNATITASPRFEDGVRLTAWANAAEDANNYEFAIASAVYLFEIPTGTQSIGILVRYSGEPHRLEIEDYEEPIAGRIWIRNIQREATRRGYHDENAKETRYGDTFVLRAKNRSELIKIPAVGHVKDGWMELHIVAEGGEQIDVEHLEVSTYRKQPKVKVIQRYTPAYRWRPWHRYTYPYFYDGPIHYPMDSHYGGLGYTHYHRWSYPIYDHHYLSIRSYYGGYLGRYRRYYSGAYYRGYSPYYGSYPGYYRGTPKVYQRRTQLNRWSSQHETARRQYSRSRLAANSRHGERTAVRRNIRTALENHRRQTPATTERIGRQSIILEKQRSRASASALQRSSVRRSTYSGSALSKQRRYPSETAQDVRSYRSSVERQRTTPLYRRSTPSSTRSFSSGTSNDSRSKYRSSLSNSSSTRSRSSINRSSSTSSSSSTRSRSSISRSTERSRISRSSSTSSSSSSRSRSSISRSSSSTKTRSRPTTSSSSSSRSSSSSSKDDDDNRSRTTERTKRRR